MPPVWNKRTYAIITGASRGIGREIAIDFSNRFAPDSLVILLARSESGLKETKDMILSKSPNIKVETYSVDFSEPKEEDLITIVTNSVKDASKYEFSVIVHNAGSLGNIGKGAADIETLSELEAYFKLNLYSMVLLNNAFLKAFPPTVPNCHRMIINITSLCAIQPMKSFTLYCSGKATREMFLKVLALEDPTLSILNYSPGPVQTDMADEIMQMLLCEDTRKRFSDLRNSGGYLTTQQTINQLVAVIDANKFKSADHVDYFDPL